MILKKKQTKAYCLSCDKEVKFVTKEEIEKCYVKGVNVEYNALKAYCPDCGKDLFVPEYDMINRKNRLDVYERIIDAIKESKTDDIKLIVYCLDCEEDVECLVRQEPFSSKIKGMEITTIDTNLYCPKCGGKLFYYAVAKENLKNAYDEYKRLNGLLTSDEIIAIRKKYHLSQTKLAKLIRCGAKNIARYELGAIQDKPIDLLIRMVDEHPEYFGIKH